MGQTLLIPCQVSKGMFSTEYAVDIDLPSGKVSLFADKDLVTQKGDNYYLEVSIAEEGKDFSKVILPTEPFGNVGRWLEVKTADLR